jgi:hypothetical protein
MNFAAMRSFPAGGHSEKVSLMVPESRVSLRAEHLGPDLNGRRGHGDDGTFFVQEFSGQEGDVSAASHDPPATEQATWLGRAKELDMQVRRRGEVAGAKAGYQSRS